MFGVIHGMVKNSFENLTTDVKIVIDFSYPDRILIGIRNFQAKSDESRRVLHTPTVSKRTRMFVLQMKSKVFFICSFVQSNKWVNSRHKNRK